MAPSQGARTCLFTARRTEIYGGRQPMNTRFSKRLRLEPIGLDHAEDLHLLHQDPAVAAWWDGAWTEQVAEQNAGRFAAGWAADGVSKWIAYDRHSGALVGRGGLSRLHLDGADRLEVGWTILGRFWGKGYATEIGTTALAVVLRGARCRGGCRLHRTAQQAVSGGDGTSRHDLPARHQPRQQPVRALQHQRDRAQPDPHRGRSHASLALVCGSAAPHPSEHRSEAPVPVRSRLSAPGPRARASTRVTGATRVPRWCDARVVPRRGAASDSPIGEPGSRRGECRAWPGSPPGCAPS